MSFRTSLPASLIRYLGRMPNRWDALQLMVLKARLGLLAGDHVYCDHMLATRSIFVHIPKTAGQSVSSSLYGQVRSGHQLWSNYYYADRNAFRDYFKFAFVRDPVDRFRSAYYYLLGGGYSVVDREFGDKILRKYDGISDFAEKWLSKSNAYSWIHFIPQYEFVCDRRGRLMVDYLARFETISEDFKTICKTMKIPASLAEINKTSEKSESDLTVEARRNVMRVYSRDYKLFGYTFDG